MSITRSSAEVILVARCGKKMEFAGMDVTVVGSNADINDPLATALIGMGFTPTNIGTVADADLAQADSTQELLDRAELRLLENIAGNLDMVDIAVGPRRESLSQLYEQVNKSITRLEDKIDRLYGGLTGTLTAGVISLDFMEDASE